MRITQINTEGRPVDLSLTGPSYQHLLIGLTRPGCHNEGFVVAVRAIPEITGPHDGWHVYVDRRKVKVNLLVARPADLFGDADTQTAEPVELPFVGADDPVDWQIAFSYDGHMYMLGNRTNTMDGEPIARLDPDTVEVTFERDDTLVDVTLP
ncbi:MAG TPA: hypothetical protein VHQ86_04040 [Candidatus Saccharimonadia bacterium]|jgi:hypothetical protein|nr:hypothetical protein [Candidatus Saccharimonadia bacterium]